MIIDILLTLGIIAFFAAFGWLHTYLASDKVKRKLAEEHGNLIAFYRISYNLIFIFTLYFFWVLYPRPDVQVYSFDYPFDLLVLGIQFLALLALIYVFKYFSLGEFTGIAQIIRYYKNEYDISELDEKLKLKIAGPYRYMRHPLYFFTFLVLIFRPEMNLFYFTSVICIAVYFYIGSEYEEKKLLEKFGSEYEVYRNKVPRFFPSKIFSPYEPAENQQEEE